MLDTMLATMTAMGNQAAVRTLQRGIASGEIADERALEAALAVLLKDAERDPEMRPLVAQLRSMLAEDASRSTPPPVRAPATPPSAAAAAARANVSVTPFRWECVQSCVGPMEAELKRDGSPAQLRLVDARGEPLGYMNFYWGELGAANALNQGRLTVNFGVGSVRACKFQSDATFYVNGRLETGLGGVGLGPEAPAMSYKTYTRSFYIPMTARVTIRPGIAANLAMNPC